MPDILQAFDSLRCNLCGHEQDAFNMIYSHEKSAQLEKLNGQGLLVRNLKCGQCGSKNFTIVSEDFSFFSSCPSCGGSGDSTSGQGACSRCGGGGAF